MRMPHAEGDAGKLELELADSQEQRTPDACNRGEITDQDCLSPLMPEVYRASVALNWRSLAVHVTTAS
jgi:hypothetical protein